MVVLNGNVTPSHEQVEEEDLECIDCVVTGEGCGGSRCYFMS